MVDLVMNLKPEKVFLIFALLLGLSLALIVPPFQAPDEEHHFFRAYQVSEGILVAGNLGAVSIPIGLWRLYLETSRDLPHQPDQKVRPSDIWAAHKIPLEPNHRVPITCRANSYGPQAYAVPALSLFLGRSLGLRPLQLYYIGRLSSLLLFIGLVYWSIHVTPLIKWVFCLLGLMPMNIFLAASFSADALTNALAFVFTALVFDLAANPEKDLSGRTIVMPAIIGALLSSIKLGAYLPMLTLTCIVPVHKARSFGKYILYLAVTIMAGVVILALWIYLSRHDLFPTYNQASHDLVGQGLTSVLAQIMQHPCDYFWLVARTTQEQLISYVAQFFGVLGWLDTVLPRWLRYTYLSMLLAAAFLDHQTELYIRGWQKIVAVLAVGLTYLAMQTMIYLTWSGPSLKLIHGFQGRYLIPVAPAFLFLFCSTKLPFKNYVRPEAKLAACCLVLLTVFTTVSVVTARYYEPNNEYIRMSFGLRKVSDPNLHIKITSAEDFSQRFFSGRNGLTGLSILITTFGNACQKMNHPYRLVLKESGSCRTVREVCFDSSGLPDWTSVDILFEPIKNSKDKEYVFTIVPGMMNNETPIGIILSERGAYPEGGAMVRGKSTERALVFKAIFQRSF